MLTLKNTRDELKDRAEELDLDQADMHEMNKKELLVWINEKEESLQSSGESADSTPDESHAQADGETEMPNGDEEEGPHVPIDIPLEGNLEDTTIEKGMAESYPLLATFCDDIRKDVDKRSGLSCTLPQMLDMGIRVMSQCKAPSPQAYRAVCKSPRSFHHRRFHTVLRRVVGTSIVGHECRAEKFHIIQSVKDLLAEKNESWVADVFKEVGKIGPEFDLTRTA